MFILIGNLQLRILSVLKSLPGVDSESFSLISLDCELSSKSHEQFINVDFGR